jgi:hypothetical protein
MRGSDIEENGAYGKNADILGNQRKGNRQGRGSCVFSLPPPFPHLANDPTWPLSCILQCLETIETVTRVSFEMLMKDLIVQLIFWKEASSLRSLVTLGQAPGLAVSWGQQNKVTRSSSHSAVFELSLSKESEGGQAMTGVPRVKGSHLHCTNKDTKNLEDKPRVSK